ncbi:pali-domain-containing protein [Mycena albidolilacea]|uniref:Pali-domain-containing protein n=1 Tax=Mycena albidolilacea TaxID=1033008 RepID=A0AAD7EKY6_9AGAR|nr:pali-domain-containing protein [Mycena albidolilacea]
MARTFYFVGMGLLFVALVLSFLSSISLPYLPALDFARVKFSGDGISGLGSLELTQVRWGIWGPCIYDGNDKRTCFHTGHGYAVPVETLNIETGATQEVIIGASWTRGLAIHPVATAAVAVAFGFAASKLEHGPLIASLTSFFAALMLLIAFAIDIALYVFVHHEIGKLKGVDANVNAGSAFWMTFVSLIFVLLAGCTVCFGRRKEGGSDSYPMFTQSSGGGFLSRFRK